VNAIDAVGDRRDLPPILAFGRFIKSITET